jgi:hypothetical protein
MIAFSGNYDGNTDVYVMPANGGTPTFLSDRDERKKLNIWAYDLTIKQTKQVTKFTEYDVKWPRLGPDAIVFENGGQLQLLDLANETSRPISILRARQSASRPGRRMGNTSPIFPIVPVNTNCTWFLEHRRQLGSRRPRGGSRLRDRKCAPRDGRRAGSAIGKSHRKD